MEPRHLCECSVDPLAKVVVRKTRAHTVLRRSKKHMCHTHTHTDTHTRTHGQAHTNGFDKKVAFFVFFLLSKYSEKNEFQIYNEQTNTPQAMICASRIGSYICSFCQLTRCAGTVCVALMLHCRLSCSIADATTNHLWRYQHLQLTIHLRLVLRPPSPSPSRISALVPIDISRCEQHGQFEGAT